MQRFADEAVITVSSGKGGDGSVAFRREKYVPMGGPAGGDGGRGGDVIFEVRTNLRTLSHLRFTQTWKAKSGEGGKGRNMHGSNGEDIVIPVPPGTLIKDFETGEVIKEFTGQSGRWRFLKGGNGGWGNVHYKSSTNQAPKFAMKGQPAQIVKLRVELNIIGDIGFVGFPNAGKSSLLDRFTNARPKIAPYPFTTKIPNLGVLTIHERDIVLADIPGIIEGASEGAGLGIRFLKHISRSAGLAFLIDLSEPNYLAAFGILLAELESFSGALPLKRRVVFGTKTDVEDTEGRLAELAASLPSEQVLGISVVSGEGLPQAAQALFDLVVAGDAVVAGEAASGAEGLGMAGKGGIEDIPEGEGSR